MRLQLVGNYTLEEFQEAVSQIIKDFKSNKIDSFRNINIYLRPCVNAREIDLTDDGHLVEHMIYDLGPRRQIAIMSAELSVVTSHKVKRKDSNEED